jgi:hypothetical protein
MTKSDVDAVGMTNEEAELAVELSPLCTARDGKCREHQRQTEKSERGEEGTEQ